MKITKKQLVQIISETVQKYIENGINEEIKLKPIKKIGRGKFNVAQLSGSESSAYTKFANEIIEINNQLTEQEKELKKAKKIIDKKIKEFKKELKDTSGLDIDDFESKIKDLKSNIKTKKKDLFNYSLKNIFPKLDKEVDKTIGLIVETKGVTSQFNAPKKKIDYISILEHLVEIGAVTQEVIDDVKKQFTTFDDSKRKLSKILPNINENLNEGILNKIKLLIVTIWTKFKNSIGDLMTSIGLKNNKLNKLVKNLNKSI